MKKSLGTALILSLLVFVMLNFLFWIIGYSMEGTLESQFDIIANYPGWIIVKLFYPMARFPWTFLDLASQTSSDGLKVIYIGYLFSLIIASIVAGLTAGDIPNAIGGWSITGVVCILLVIVAVYEEYVRWLGYEFLGTLEEVIVEIIVSGILNIIIFGCVAVLIALIVGKSKSYKK